LDVHDWCFQSVSCYGQRASPDQGAGITRIYHVDRRNASKRKAALHRRHDKSADAHRSMMEPHANVHPPQSPTAQRRATLDGLRILLLAPLASLNKRAAPKHLDAALSAPFCTRRALDCFSLITLSFASSPKFGMTHVQSIELALPKALNLSRRSQIHAQAPK